MKKGLFLVALLMLGLGASFAFAAEDEWGNITIPKGSPIHLGFASALSGGNANYGLDQENGIKLAFEDYAAALGKPAVEIQGFPVELLREDDECEGSPAMAIAEKFCSDPLFVGMIGNMCSGGSIPASETYNKHGFTMISPSSTNYKFTDRGMQNVFRTCFNDAVQGKVAGEFAANTLKKKTVAILHDKSQYGQPIAENFQKSFEANGGKTVIFEGITRNDKDFRPILTKIKPMNPQVVYFGGMSAEGTLIMRQLREVGIDKAVFLSDDGCYSEPDFILGAGETSEGAYVTFAKPASGDFYAKFEARFVAKYGNKPVAFGPQAYDATFVYFKALEAVAKVQPDGSLQIGKKALSDAIRAIKFEGATGTVGFQENGDSLSTVAVWLVKDRKFELVP